MNKVETNQERPILLTIVEVAAALSLGRSTIYEMISAGELPVCRIGRSVRIPRAAIESMVESRTELRSKSGFPGWKILSSRVA